MIERIIYLYFINTWAHNFQTCNVANVYDDPDIDLLVEDGVIGTEEMEVLELKEKLLEKRKGNTLRWTNTTRRNRHKTHFLLER